jgi:hypothetical protein
MSFTAKIEGYRLFTQPLSSPFECETYVTVFICGEYLILKHESNESVDTV